MWGTPAKRINTEQRSMMRRYQCDVCEYIYNPEEGDIEHDVEPGTDFESLPDDWVCPLCGVGKEEFSPVE